MTEQTDSAPAPRANPDLLGQEAVEQELIKACATGRLPHAWILTGPAGIGKATLAFRFARYLFSGARNPDSLAVDVRDPLFRRVASGGHADLLTVERQFDEDRGRTKKDIAVDDVRKIAPFLRLTAAEGGARVVIVDGADGMNRSGQNAILKILEEPPDGAVLMLLTERPMQLLPTIRSRCRLLAVPPLPDHIVDDLVARYRPDLGSEQRRRLVRLGEGSIGRALDIARHDGLALFESFLAIAAHQPTDWPAAHALGDKLGAAAADESYRTLSQLVIDWLARATRGAARRGPIDGPELVPGEHALVGRLAEGGRLERGLEVWEKVVRLFARADGANLDRRLTVLSALDMVSAALR